MVDPSPIQGMMLSERPGGSMQPSINEPSVGIGSYKGVMLCNRPFAGAAVGAQGTAPAGDGTAAFNCGTVPKVVGANVPISSNEKVLSRNKTKKDSALSRHKKWLADLQKTKERLEHEYLDDMEKKKESRRKFMENQAKMRAMVRGQLQQAKEAGDRAYEGKYDEDGDFTDEFDDKGDLDFGMDPNFDMDSDSKQSKPKSAGSKKDRPAWALTEEEAAEAAEAKEQAEVDDLLNFTKELDFDKYIHDMEIQTMIDQVMKRISELENMEEDDIPEEDLRGELEKQRSELSRLTGANLRRFEQSQKESGESKDFEQEEDVRSLAKSVMSEGGRSQWSVHSHKSINQIASRAKEKMKKEILDSVPEGEGSALKIQPRVISHEEDRFENKNKISNLPYMHRNPAI